MDGGYGNNSSLLTQLEEKELKYIGVIAKNRNVCLIEKGKIFEEKSIENIASSLSRKSFEEVKISSNKEKTLWVATIKVKLNNLSGTKTVAIVMNANSFDDATEIDYLMTNETEEKANPNWIVLTYSQRNTD